MKELDGELGRLKDEVVNLTLRENNMAITFVQNFKRKSDFDNSWTKFSDMVQSHAKGGVKSNLNPNSNGNQEKISIPERMLLEDGILSALSVNKMKATSVTTGN